MAERNRLKRREKRQLMKDLKKLEHFIGLSRTRLSGYLVSFDQNRTCILPRNIVIGILEKIRVPVEGFVVDILCDAMEENGAIDYRLLFKGGYCNMVDKHMNRLDQAERNVNRDTSEESCVEKDDKGSGVVNGGFSDSRDGPLEGLGSTNLLTFSTMEGKIGEWSETIKEESYRQFMKLIYFCQKHDLMLDYSLVKKGINMINRVHVHVHVQCRWLYSKLFDIMSDESPGYMLLWRLHFNEFSMCHYNRHDCFYKPTSCTVHVLCN